MEKSKLAICMEDEEYKQRFVNCVMKHYKELFEIHVVNELCELGTNADEKFEAVIIGDDYETDADIFQKQVWVVLKEDNREQDAKENVYFAEKYQEVYKIMEVLQKAISGKNGTVHRQTKGKMPLRIGVFSLGKESLQIPFAALLAEIMGEDHHVLVMDLQPFSGLSMEIETEGVLGMEDLISIASTENYTIHRLFASIGHEQKWEYIYPVKNTICLAEVETDTYKKMLKILELEQGYTCEIINFGAIFPGVFELMESCQQIHILTEKEGEPNYRENTFIKELYRRGKDMLLKKLMWTEIPVQRVRNCSWKQICKQWMWNSLGDSLREIYWVKYTDGTDM